MNDFERQNRGFYGFFGDFGLRHKFMSFTRWHRVTIVRHMRSRYRIWYLYINLAWTPQFSAKLLNRNCYKLFAHLVSIGSNFLFHFAPNFFCLVHLRDVSVNFSVTLMMSCCRMLGDGPGRLGWRWTDRSLCSACHWSSSRRDGIWSVRHVAVDGRFSWSQFPRVPAHGPPTELCARCCTPSLCSVPRWNICQGRSQWLVSDLSFADI